MRGSDHSRRRVSEPGRLPDGCRKAFDPEYSRSIAYCRSSVGRQAPLDVTRNSGYRQALIESSIVTNAALSAYSIQQEFVAHDLPELQAVYGVYLLDTREVWAPHPGNIKGGGLAAAPHDLAGFADLGNAVVQSDRIAAYLKPGK